MKFFLSSTYIDLKDIRQVAINYLDGIVGHVSNATGEIVAMEYFNATENTCKEECLRELYSCNLVIGIYGQRYGTVDEETNLSLTEIEFDYAVEHGIPILAFVMCAETQERDEREKQFIDSKVYARKVSCAKFSNAEEFADRLNSSLKEYLGNLDGYSVDSLWDQVISLNQEICTSLATDPSDPGLQMLPYTPRQDMEAINKIIESANCLKGYTVNLSKENDAVHSYAYTAQHYPENLKTESVVGLAENVRECSDVILENWLLINLGIYNHATSIILAATYLKLRSMQQRLLVETWSEELRQEVVKTREQYLETIRCSGYRD